jgi:hypothetical protein
MEILAGKMRLTQDLSIPPVPRGDELLVDVLKFSFVYSVITLQWAIHRSLTNSSMPNVMGKP